MQNNTKCAFVAVVGEPNAGKSTLVNAMVNEKVSIVSRKAQTTRKQIRGIAELDDSTQIVFVDTPGFCKPNSPLEKVIDKNFKNSYQDSDLILLLIDATSKYIDSSFDFISKAEPFKIPLSVIINKVDVAKKEDILRIAGKLSPCPSVDRVFMISALNQDGIDDVKKYLKEVAPCGPWLYEKNQSTDIPQKFRLAEITREKIFNHLDKELPYSIYVETEDIHESEKKVRIHQSIVVMKDSQKGIVLGKAGGMIKTIKDEAIRDIKQLLHKKVELKLFVKVKEKWTEKKAHLQNAGIID